MLILPSAVSKTDSCVNTVFGVELVGVDQIYQNKLMIVSKNS